MSQLEAELLTSDRELADFFEQTASTCRDSRNAANWITGELMARLNRDGVGLAKSRITPEMLGDLIAKINDNSVSGKIAKDVFDAMWDGEGNASDIIASKNLQQITNSDEIERAVDDVIDNFTSQVVQYRSGQQKVFGFLVGKVMLATEGKANPETVNKILRDKLGA